MCAPFLDYPKAKYKLDQICVIGLIAGARYNLNFLKTVNTNLVI